MASRAACCTAPEQIAVHDRVFDSFFGQAGLPPRPPETLGIESPAPGTPGADDAAEDQQLPVTSASRTERLRRRDLAEATATERDDALLLIDSLVVRPPTRVSARRQRAPHGSVDRRRTIRQLQRTGGEVSHLRYRARTRRARPVVVIVDVSGSMRSWVDVGLRFARRVVRVLPHAEAFTAGTRLARVTGALRAPTTERLWREFIAEVPDFAGGTRLGDALAALLDDWGRRGPLRGAVVVVFSDGWEHGGAERLGRQMERLRRLTHRIIWINPRSGQEGWQPQTAGMSAVMPSLDALVAGHTVEDLQGAADLFSTANQGSDNA
nr:VWA domain-containing protein [Brevibacterium daeguense]